MNTIKILSYLFISIFLNSCANISPPTGGAKDLDPPILVKSKPASESINFNGNIIELLFNERIAINNMKEQLLINPRPKSDYEIFSNKGLVRLTFTEPLDRNTTYSLNFREAIRDVTENNPVIDLKLAFSTGPTIDTLKITGKALDYEKNIPMENAIVGLYSPGDTNTIINNAPSYYGRTDKQGNFQITNLKENTYHIFALGDVNKNFKYDKPEEKIGFIDSVYINSDTTININSVLINTKPIRITQETSPKYTILELNKGVRTASIRRLNSDSVKYIFINSNKIKVYTDAYFETTDSIKLEISLTDSLYSTFIDTINLKMTIPAKSQTKEIKKRLDPISKITPETLKLTPNENHIKLTFNDPVKNFNQDSLIIVRDKEKLDHTQYQLNWNLGKTALDIITKDKVKDSLKISFPKATFITIVDDTNKRRKLIFTPIQEEETSILEGIIDTDEKNFIVELLDQNYNPIKRINNKKEFRFDYINPGKYYLRAFIDSNKNNELDKGNFLKFIQPERIIFYPEPFNLRANWEIIDLKFTF